MPLNIVRNDITKMNTEAIVNTANEYAVVGAGCDSAVYKAAGYEKLLAYRKEKIGVVPEGDAFITPGFDLQAKYIIHAVSPLYMDGNEGEEEKLRSCYRKSLQLAKENGIRSISFPLIATGSFGYPKEEGMRIAVDEINAFLLSNRMDIFLVVFSDRAKTLGKRIYPDLEEYIDQNYVEEKWGEEYGGDLFGASGYSGSGYLPGEPGTHRPAPGAAGPPAQKKEAPKSGASKQDKPRAGTSRRFDLRSIFRKDGRETPPAQEAAARPPQEAAPKPSPKPSPKAPPKAAIRPPASAMPPQKESEVKTPQEQSAMRPAADMEKYAQTEAELSDFETEHMRKLNERIRHISDTFSQYLMYLIQDKKMENADVYKRAIVDKKTFSKIKNNVDYHPQKLTALCLCVGAKLNLDESRDLLARAGYALSPCDKTDIIFSYFIENKIYDMIELDIQLEEHGLPCIIS